MTELQEKWVAIPKAGGKWDVDTASGLYVAMNLSGDHARLIAQAPAMLEALKMVMEEKAPRYHDCTDDGLPKCAWCFAEEVIAAATGGTHD